PRQPQVLIKIAELDPAGRGVFWLMYGPEYQPQEGGAVPYDFTVPYVRVPQEEKRELLPVLGHVSAGKLDIVWTDAGFPVGGGLYKIERPEWLKDKNAFGLEVRGDSMYPPFAPGTVIVADTKAQVVNRDMIICRVKSLEAYWKIYSERHHDGSLTVNFPVRLERLHSADNHVAVDDLRLRVGDDHRAWREWRVHRIAAHLQSKSVLVFEPFRPFYFI